MDEPFDHEAEHPPYPFVSGNSLLALTQKHNVRRPPRLHPVTYIRISIPRIDRRFTFQMTIAQIVYDNEKYFGYTDDDIHDKVIYLLASFDSFLKLRCLSQIADAHMASHG